MFVSAGFTGFTLNMNGQSNGHIEHYYASILAAIRELEAMFPSGKATKLEFRTNKQKLLNLFHIMGSSAMKARWHKPTWPKGNPYSQFAGFKPAELDSKRFTYGYFQRCMEDTVRNTDLVKKLSLLAGEGNRKYEAVLDKRKGKLKTLLDEYSAVKQKCWFALAALVAVLAGTSVVLAELRVWLFYVLFALPIAGSLPMCWVVFLPSTREVVVEEVDNFWNKTHLDAIYSSIRDTDTEIKYMEGNREVWRKQWKRGRQYITSGAAAAVMLASVMIIAITC